VEPVKKEAQRVHEAVIAGKALVQITPEEEEGLAFQADDDASSSSSAGVQEHRWEIRSGVALTLGECASVV
jgi:hypothetical protein